MFDLVIRWMTMIFFLFRTLLVLALNIGIFYFCFTACGSSIAASKGVISSPRYPLTYETNEYCIWRVTVPDNQVVHIRFESMYITRGTTSHCNPEGDFLQIQELDRTGDLLGFYCGRKVPGPITTSSNQVWISFHSDSDGDAAGNGFKLTFTAIDPPVSFHGIHLNELQLETGIGNIEAEASTSNRATTTERSAAMTSIQAAIAEKSATTESVQATSNIMLTSNKASTTERSATTASIQATSSTLASTQATTPERSPIMASIQATTTTTLASERTSTRTSARADSTKITTLASTRAITTEKSATKGPVIEATSTNRPRATESATDGIVTTALSALTEGITKLEQVKTPAVTTRSIAPSSPSYATSEGNSDQYHQSTSVSERKQSDTLTTHAQSTMASKMPVVNERFVKPAQDGQDTGQPAPPARCRDVLVEPSGNFTSPLYPSWYEKNLICTWTILADPLEYIALRFTDFDIDNPMPNGMCDERYSYVRISYFDSKGEVASDQFCGSELPLDITISYSNQMVVYFFSELGYGKGFVAEYDNFNPDPEIDGAPVFPERPLHPGDEYSFLDYSSRYWQLNLGENIYDTCGDLIETSGSVFASPGYPVGYKELVCLWIIVAKPGQNIKVEFQHFNVGIQPEDDTCDISPALVEVSYYDVSGHLMSKELCGDNIESSSVIVSLSGRAYVSFTSYQEGPKGFRAEVTFLDPQDDDPFQLYDMKNIASPTPESDFCRRMNTECCYDVSEGLPYGTIVSPGYPDGYDRYLNCKWIIQGDHNQSISLHFTDFQLDSIVQENEECSFDKSLVRVVYFDGNYRMQEQFLCGHSQPATVVSDFHTMYVEFYTFGKHNLNSMDKGFTAVYLKEDKADSDAGKSQGDEDNLGGGIFRGLLPFMPVWNPLNYTLVSTENPSPDVVTDIEPESSGDGITSRPVITKRPRITKRKRPQDGESNPENLDTELFTQTTISSERKNHTMLQDMKTTNMPAMKSVNNSEVDDGLKVRSTKKTPIDESEMNPDDTETELPFFDYDDATVSWGESFVYEFEETSKEPEITIPDVELLDVTSDTNTPAGGLDDPDDKDEMAPSETVPLFSGTEATVLNETQPGKLESPHGTSESAKESSTDLEPLRNDTGSHEPSADQSSRNDTESHDQSAEPDASKNTSQNSFTTGHMVTDFIASDVNNHSYQIPAEDTQNSTQNGTSGGPIINIGDRFISFPDIGRPPPDSPKRGTQLPYTEEQNTSDVSTTTFVSIKLPSGETSTTEEIQPKNTVITEGMEDQTTMITDENIKGKCLYFHQK